MTINKKFRQDHPSAWMVSRVKTQVLTEIPKEPDTPSFSEILRQKSPAKLPPTRQPPSSWSPSQEEDEPTFGSDWNSFPSFDDSRDSSTRSRFTEPPRSSRDLSSSRMPQRDLLISPNAHSLRDVQPLAPSLDRFSQIYGGNGSQKSFFNLDFNLRPPETPQATLEEIRDKLAQLQRTLPPAQVRSGYQDSRVRSDRAQGLFPREPDNNFDRQRPTDDFHGSRGGQGFRSGREDQSNRYDGDYQRRQSSSWREDAQRGRPSDDRFRSRPYSLPKWF